MRPWRNAAWADFAEKADAILSPGEPQPQERDIPYLQIQDYQRRTWATRRHLWVDRVASAWLIQRFIDSKAAFLWLDSPANCPVDALGFDFNDATFTHVGNKVTFEVLVASFQLPSTPGMAKLAALVHALDAGGEAPAEAAGFEAILTGARARLADDDAFLAEVGSISILSTLIATRKRHECHRRKNTVHPLANGALHAAPGHPRIWRPGGLGRLHARDLVEERKWISDADYKEGLALAQLAPGPLAANWKLPGLRPLPHLGCHHRRTRLRSAVVLHGRGAGLGLHAFWRP
jgi:hypothetical protein